MPAFLHSTIRIPYRKTADSTKGEVRLFSVYFNQSHHLLLFVQWLNPIVMSYHY